MRILHTSDWHLGHGLHGRARDAEHQRFLDWLLDRIDEHMVDALIIPGDIFDSANPPTSALRAWYGFLGAARKRNRMLDVVVVGGNHDSAARLDAPRALLEPLDVRVIGGVPRDADGAIDYDAMVVPLTDSAGEVEVWVAAVPFLRPADLPRVELPEVPDDQPQPDPLVEGVREVYRRTFEAARARMQPGQSILATGHCYMRGGRISEDSERKVLGGNQHALPLDVFPSDVVYVALGHLHLAQAVGGVEHVRYCGAPLPLSMAEREYPHQILLVDIVDGELHGIRSVAAPAGVEMMRVPVAGYEPVDTVLERIAALPTVDRARPEWTRPFLEVAVRLDAPEPGLRLRVEEALAGKHARLARLVVERPGRGRALADEVPDAQLGTLNAEEVFRRKWARQHPGEPPEPLLERFHELLHEIEQDEA